ncbi:MAG: amino acid permease, partial [Pseudomonadales bacterium]
MGDGSSVNLKRDIGKWGARFLVLNCVIGAGIYGLPGTLQDLAGNFSPWLFVIFGVLILSIVLTFAVLASYFSNTGGPILYASSAFGPFVGFQTGWLL